MVEKVIAVNRKAYHDYFVEETYEAGIALTGTEIKSIRAGRIDLQDSYAQVKEGEVLLLNAHIAPYQHAGYTNHEPRRPRRLLLHRHQIHRLANKMAMGGYTLIPLRLYLKSGLAKVEIGLAKGKKLYDKRAAIAEREAQREMERAQKETSARRRKRS